MLRVCPWWLTYTFDNPLRRLLHDRSEILGPHVQPGATVADFGCGMGYFTIGLARLVGPAGKVLAVDVQQRQLDHTARRCERAGLRDRVELVLARPPGVRIGTSIDFALSFWMLHEVDGLERFVADVATALVPGGRWLVAEPRMHIGARRFADELALVERHGFASRPIDVRWSRAAVLSKT
jgi:ubiquinone/menaquinone biosynthesis C-methylase UbiE